MNLLAALHGVRAPMAPMVQPPAQVPSAALPLSALALALIATAMPSHAIEEPAYDVVRRLDDAVEVRQYAPYVVAEVRVPGPSDSAGRQAFPILAGYIFGKNKGERKLQMTAPVTQMPASAVPVKMEMTAPVTQSATGSSFVVQFVLPRGVTLATAPEPDDPRVELREVPAARLAAIRYSGFWSASNDGEHLARLQAVLRSAGIAWTGEPVLSRYNGPMTPWFLRRNEIWLRVADGAAGSGAR